MGFAPPNSPSEDLPQTLAYLMTDVVGSTRLWEIDRVEMAKAVARLDQACDQTFQQARGEVVKSRGEGDSHFGVFRTAEDAITAATSLCVALKQDPLLSKLTLRVAVHLGTADTWAGDYYGPVVNRCARIRQASQPGQILVSEAVQIVASRTGSFDFKDLGVHRLRDLMHPERLFQVVHEGLDQDFRPPQTLSEFAHNLPIHLSSFVGRKQEIGELGSLIASNRLVTVAGPGGVGKTRLTQQVAAERINDFIDGPWFIDLAQTERPESVIPILCKELDAGTEGSEAVLLGELEHREMLLILDNCEHLFDECRRLATLLLKRCPKLHILATSRRLLDVPGEHVFRLAGLSLPAPESMLDAPQYDGFQLFVERAKQRGTGLMVTESTIPEIVALCRKLDGLPLAIEMAASLTDVLSIKEIANSIAEYLQAPTGASPEDPRQHTIASTIDWSRKLLSPDAKLLLDRVAYFPNTWTLEGASKVCLPDHPASRVREWVKELLNHSLIFSVRTPHDDLRFGLLQTTREVVARDQQVSAELVRDYVAFCRTIIESARDLMDSGEEVRAHDMVSLEYETLIKALQLSHQSDPAASAEIALGLRTFWMSGTRLPEGKAWYEILVKAEPLDRLTRASIQSALSSLYILLGDNDAALNILVAATETVRAIGGFEFGRVIGNLAVHRDRMGRYEEAKEGFEQCQQLFRECGAKREEALSMLNIGVAMLRLHEPLSECAHLFRQALHQAKMHEFTAIQAKAYSCLAHIDLKQDLIREALQGNKDALWLWLKDPMIADCGLAMLDLADIFVRLTKYPEATKFIHIAERLAQLAHSPFPSLHIARLEASRTAARPHLSASEWRSSQRATFSKSEKELITVAIQVIESEEANYA